MNILCIYTEETLQGQVPASSVGVIENSLSVYTILTPNFPQCFMCQLLLRNVSASVPPKN